MILCVKKSSAKVDTGLNNLWIKDAIKDQSPSCYSAIFSLLALVSACIVWCYSIAAKITTITNTAVTKVEDEASLAYVFS